MKNILIIGGNGYLGSNIVYRLIKNEKYNINLLSSTEIESDLSGDAKFPSKFRKQFRIVKSSMLMEDPDTKVKYRRNIYKQLFSD